MRSPLAEATGRTTQQLADDLQKGKVWLRSSSPTTSSCSARNTNLLPVASQIRRSWRPPNTLNDLNIAVGKLLGPIGAAFQDVFTAIAEDITGTADALADSSASASTTVRRSSASSSRPRQPRTVSSKLTTPAASTTGTAPTTVALLEKELALLKAQKTIAEALDQTKPPTDPDLGGNTATDTLEKQLQAGQDLSREFSRTYKLLQATSDLERDLLQVRFDQEDRMRAIADAAADQRAELTALSDDLAAAQAGTVIGEALGQDLVGIAENLKTALNDAQGEFNDFFQNEVKDPFEKVLKASGQRVADALTNTIGTAIEGLITGADNLNESLQRIASTLLRDISQIFLKQLSATSVVRGKQDQDCLERCSLARHRADQ